MIDGPFADDLTLGTPLPLAPSITIDSGVASSYQMITGDPLRLALSDVDSVAVAGDGGRVVNPALALQVAIGQSTVATRRVIANLFYRDVALHRQVRIGDTLTTTVTPTALALTRPAPAGRRAKVLLHVHTVDQDGRTVASFERLALLPCREDKDVLEHGSVGNATADRALNYYLPYVPQDWTLARFPLIASTPLSQPATDPLADTVSSALELVRLTQNLASAHRDPARGSTGRRLVYGGHTIGLAQASLARMVPGLVTVLGWRSCDHLAPVFDGDVLGFRSELLDTIRYDDHAMVAGFRVVAHVRTSADLGNAGRDAEDCVDVLDWKPVVLLRNNGRMVTS